jgi:PST family polysaccharide transporter
MSKNNIIDSLKNHQSLVESFFSLSILNGLNILLPLISLPYILRIVGAANYGAYSYVYVLVQYLLLITSYGFNYSATKQISQNRDNPEKVNNVYNSIIACRFMLLGISIVFFWLLSSLLLKTEVDKLMFLMGVGMVIGDILNPAWLFQGMEKMRYMTIVNIISKCVFTILIFVFIRRASDYMYIILFNSCGFLLSGLSSTFIAKKQFKIHFSFPNRKDIKYQFKEGLELFGSTIGINFYSNVNIFILKFFVNDSVLGIYSAAEKIIIGLKLLSSPISQSLFPHMGYKFMNQSPKDSLQQLKRAAKPFALILLVLSVLTFAFSEILIKLLGGKEYVEGNILIRIMSSTILLGGLNSLLGFSGLVNLNHQKDFLRGVFLAGITCITFLLIFVPQGGVQIAAWASVLSEAILFGVILFSFYNINIKNR